METKPRHHTYKHIKWLKGISKSSTAVEEVQSETDNRHYARKNFYIGGMSEAERSKVLAESEERMSLQHPFINPVTHCYNHEDEYGN